MLPPQVLTTCHTTCHTTDGGVVSAGGRGRHNVTEGRTRVTVIEAVKQRGSGELTLVPTLYPRAPPRRASFVVFSVSSRFYRAVGAASRGYPPGRFLHRTERSPCTKQSRKLRTRLSSEPSFGTIHRRYYLLRASRVPTGTTTNPWERCVMPGSVSPTSTATIENDDRDVNSSRPSSDQKPASNVLKYPTAERRQDNRDSGAV